MAKEAICALLAILEHFFEAFSPLDLFFCPRTLSARILGFSLFSSIPVVVAFCLCPSRFFIDSNLFHLPPVRSSQHHPGLVPIPLGDIRPCCLHLPSFCRSRLLSLFGAACRHLIACLCDGSLPLPAPPRQAHLPKPSCLRLRRRPCLPKPPGPSSVSVRLAPPSSAISGFRRLVSPRSRACPRLRFPAYPCSRSRTCAFLPARSYLLLPLPLELVPAPFPAAAPRTGPLPLYLPHSIAVRTRGVFTHRDNFQKSACVERGLVRTAMFHAPRRFNGRALP